MATPVELSSLPDARWAPVGLAAPNYHGERGGPQSALSSPLDGTQKKDR